MAVALDESLISVAVRYPELFTKLQRAGLSEEYFIDEYKDVWAFLRKTRRDYKRIPSPSVLHTRFPQLEIERVRKKDIPILLSDIRKRKQYIDLMEAVEEAVNGDDYEDIDKTISQLQSRINSISSQNGKSHLVDLFSPSTRKRMIEEIVRRKVGRRKGIPTGLSKMDNSFGGLHKQQMVTVIGRSGNFKSWISLWTVATAVISGQKVILYPLEMSLPEVAFRLYTIFTQKCFGPNKVLKNLDLLTGKVTTSKLTKFLSILEDRFAGQLYVADVGSLGDPYTNERIEAEVDLHKPDMFWVDYLTLMKTPSKELTDDWVSVRALSHGIKMTAMRKMCVGGCSAQVNREAIKGNVFLPRLEHIAQSDAIGQDSDLVISIRKHNHYLWWALVKNRTGPEIARSRVKFDANLGSLIEPPVQEEED